MRYSSSKKGQAMNFIHTDVTVDGEAVVIVTLGHHANVMLLNQMSYQAYREGRLFLYEDGGWSTRTPARLHIPSAGHWHIIVDFFGAPGRIDASVLVVERNSGDPVLRRRRTTPAARPKVNSAAMILERGQPSQAAIHRRLLREARERQVSRERREKRQKRAELLKQIAQGARRPTMPKTTRTAIKSRTTKVTKAEKAAK
jgi:hypothetical protein